MQRMTRTAAQALSGLVALFAALLAYSAWLPAPQTAARPLDRARFAVTEEAKVRAGLLDPEGARFRELRVSTLRQVPVLCGEVNERTPAGGYAGYRRFLSGPTIRLHERDLDRVDMDRAWQALCDDHAPVRAAPK
ncbi:MAG: hypothetical protein IT520_09505 [Burkholderiales bacterium]|nr:hypothetical protein [Burkholderiales bacterium]